MKSHFNKIQKHKNGVYIVIIVLMVIQISSVSVLGWKVIELSKELDSTQGSIEQNFISTANTDNRTLQALSAIQKQNQKTINDISKNLSKFDEIVKNLSKEQSDVKQDIGELKSDNGDFSNVVQNSMKSVVSISTERSAGTGFFIDDKGLIVTNLHVLVGSSKVFVETENGNTFTAEYIGGDSLRDIALLKINSSEYSPLRFADAESLRVGGKVFAVGNPLGLSFTVTQGIISALNRPGTNGLNEYVQTDVPLNPGNSGGPLINSEGEVVGMNNFKIGGADNIGFALESDSIMRSIEGLLEDKVNILR